MRTTWLLILVGLTACAPTAVNSTTGPQAGVEVVMTATPVVSGEAIELCPPGMTDRCPGVILDGDLDPSLLANQGDYPPVIEIEGLYDGRQLVPTGNPRLVDPYPPLASIDFSSLCPELSGAGSPDSYSEAINSYVQTVTGSFAGMWWDQASAVMTVWFVGDEIATHRTAISNFVPEGEVCVAGGARYSEAELMEAMETLSSFGPRLTTGGYGVNTVANRIELSVQEMDAFLRQELMDALGDKVVIYSYMDLLSVTLEELPVPIAAIPGDVDLLTSRLRAGGGMDALGIFTVAYDADLNCIYFHEAASAVRVVPVWPFGYSAIGDPVELYDYDGQFIGGQGTLLELGGGNVGIEFIEGNTCGAQSAWIVNG